MCKLYGDEVWFLPDGMSFGFTNEDTTRADSGSNEQRAIYG